MRIPSGPSIRLDPASMAWNAVASFGSYDEAQAAVDRLSDDGFPVEHIDIVGSDLRLVERVTGRLTKGRDPTAGIAGGAVFGRLVGLAVGLVRTWAHWCRVRLRRGV